MKEKGENEKRRGRDVGGICEIAANISPICAARF
mgnify:CR=1 FL=1